MVYEVGVEKTTFVCMVFLGAACFFGSVYLTLFLKKHNLVSFLLAFCGVLVFGVCSQAMVTGGVFYNTPCFNTSYSNSSEGILSVEVGFNCPVYYGDVGLGLLFFLFIVLCILMLLFSGLGPLLGYGGY